MKYELRADGALHIEGYVNAVERDSKTVVCPECGKCVEQIQAGAFGEALRAADNVDLLLNHNRSRRLGSTSEGNLSLYEDNIGLRATADITDSEVIEKARHGLLRGWSFGFKALKTDIEQRAKSVPRRHVKSLAIFEVSLIDDTKQPCYAGTSIEMRGGDGETVIETREFTEGISPAELEKQYKKLLRWRNITKRCVYHGLAKPQLFFKACEEVRAFEMRYNPNHDEHGRFTFGDGRASGGYVNYVPRGQKGNGQMMFVGAGDTMAQNDALYYSMYGTKAQSALTNSANSGKIEETAGENKLNSGSTTSTAVKKNISEYKSVTECEDFDQLKQYMKDKYKVNVDDDVKNLHFESVRDSLVGFEEMAQEFPEIADNLQTIGTTDKNGTVADTNGTKLRYGIEYFQSKESVENFYKNNTYSAAQSPKDTVIHESAHMVNKAIINKMYNNRAEAEADWNDNTTAKDIVQTAYKQTTGENSLSGINKAREKLSGYAKKGGDGEALAEAFVKAGRESNTDTFASNIKQETKKCYNQYCRH